MASRINDDIHISGTLTCTALDIPAGTIDNADVSASAAIAATKTVNRVRAFLNQAHGTAGTTERRTVYAARASGTIVNAWAVLSVAASGAATHTIAIKKNGSDILTSSIVLDNANTAYDDEAAAGFSSSAIAAGDCLEIAVTAAAGGGTLGQGLLVCVEIDENPS